MEKLKQTEGLAPQRKVKRKSLMNSGDSSAFYHRNNQGYITNQSKKRSMMGWKASAGTANEDILGKQSALRAVCRDLYMNSSLGKSVILRYKTNTLGLGLRHKCQINRKVLGFKEIDPRADKLEAIIESEWSLYSEGFSSDAERTLDVNENGTLSFVTMILSGDSFVTLPRVDYAGDTYKTKIKVVEGDYVSNPRGTQDTNRTAGGVEVNALGAPIAYQFMKTDLDAPLDTSFSNYKWQKIDRFAKNGLEQVLHLFQKERPGQRRGVSILSSVIQDIKEATRYKEAEVDAAILNAMFTVFIETIDNTLGPALQDGFVPASQTSLPTDTPVSTEEEPEKRLYEMGKASIIEMDKNQKITLADPNHPIAGFAQFQEALATEIAASTNLSYEVLVNRFQASFSASKAALKEAWKSFLYFREYMVKHYYRPVYKTFFYEAVITGRIKAPGFFDNPIIQNAYLEANWIGQGEGMIDPLKETSAAEKRVKNRFTTREEERRNFKDGSWAGTMSNFAKEEELLNELDIHPNKLELAKINSSQTENTKESSKNEETESTK